MGQGTSLQVPQEKLWLHKPVNTWQGREGAASPGESYPGAAGKGGSQTDLPPQPQAHGSAPATGSSQLKVRQARVMGRTQTRSDPRFAEGFQ